MTISALMAEMAAKGASLDVILMAVRAVEAEQQKIADGRAQAAARKRRQRERERDSHATVTGLSGDIEGQAPAPDKSLPQTPSKINPTPGVICAPACEADPIDPAAEPVPGRPEPVEQVVAEPTDAEIAAAEAERIRAEAEREAAEAARLAKRWKGMPPPAGVTDEQWQGFLDHRKSKRQTLTPRAYQLLNGKLAKHSDPEWPPGRIIDTIIDRHWTSFEPAWLDKIAEHQNGKRAHQNSSVARGRRFRDALLQRDYDAGIINP